jgi:hypothetical protein
MGFKNKFDSGELDKWCLGAIDDPAYQRGVAWLENFNQLENGGLNRRRGYKYLAQILAGVDDKSVKLVPVNVDENTNYILYIAKSRYGYLKFTGYELISSKEYSWPAPFVVPPNNVVQHHLYDPDEFYQIESMGSFTTMDEIDIGAEAEIALPNPRENAAFRIDTRVESTGGQITALTGYSITPQYEFAGGVVPVTQDNSGEAGSSYFEETGAGSGLSVQCTLTPLPTDLCSLEFMITNGGTGYRNGTLPIYINDDRLLRAYAAEATVKNGIVQSIKKIMVLPSEQPSGATIFTPDECYVPIGSGARLAVACTPDFGPTDGTPKMHVSVEVAVPGSGYFRKGGDTNINVNVILGTNSYLYSMTIPCESSQELTITGGTYSKTFELKTTNSLPINMSVYTINEQTAEGVEPTQSANVMVNVTKNTTAWDIAVALNVEDGRTFSTMGWKVGDRYMLNGDPGGFITAIIPAKNYALSFALDEAGVPRKGDYITNPASKEGSASFDGHAGVIKILTTSFHTDSLLKDVKPVAAYWKVNQDEQAAMTTTYWYGKAPASGKPLEWVEQVVSQYPKTEDTIRGLQYVYNGKIAVFAGKDITPFTIEISGDNLLLDKITIITKADIEITKPDYVSPTIKVSPLDPVVPVSFCKTVYDSPTVIYYDNGRWWFASTPREPDRIWVSKQVADSGDKTLDFTTFKYFCTFHDKLSAFTGENSPFSNIITNTSDGAIGQAIDIINSVELKKGDVVFNRINPQILATSYFPDGATVLDARDSLILSKENVPRPGEYTAMSAQKLRAKTAQSVAWAKNTWAVPFGAGCIVASADGFSVNIISGMQIGFLGVSTGGGSQSIAAQIIPFSGWGQDMSARIATIGLAAATIIAAASPLMALAAGIIGGSMLTGLSVSAAKLMDGLLSGIGLTLTDGKAAYVSGSEYGAVQFANSGTLAAKAEYLLAKNKLYEPLQPFVLRIFEVTEDKYSTADCGFSFTMTSNEKETINLISGNRALFISTTSSERSMPATVNGAAQSAQTGSFYGSEKILPAKAADSLYFVQNGGQRIMRSFWEPNVPVPSVTSMQTYNREILRGLKIISLKSSKSLPSKVWCVLSSGDAAVLTDMAGFPAWGRITTEGDIFDCATFPVNGKNEFRVLAINTPTGLLICGAEEEQSSPDDIFLDSWREYISESMLAEYSADAVIYDKNNDKIYDKEHAPPPGFGNFIGYQYMSKFRTLPSPKIDLSPSRIARVKLRFLESVLPFIRGYPTGQVDKIVSPSSDRVIDGIADIPVPGNIERDAAFEVFTNAPYPLSVVCMYSEEE